MILKKGSKGKEVKELQLLLEISVDGIFGPGTEKSVKQFQKENKLIIDGIVGPATWGLIQLIDDTEPFSTDDSERIFETFNGIVDNNDCGSLF